MYEHLKWAPHQCVLFFVRNCKTNTNKRERGIYTQSSAHIENYHICTRQNNNTPCAPLCQRNIRYSQNVNILMLNVLCCFRNFFFFYFFFFFFSFTFRCCVFFSSFDFHFKYYEYSLSNVELSAHKMYLLEFFFLLFICSAYLQ